MGPRPRYSSQDKARFLRTARLYNKASQNVEKEPGEFVRLSLQLHVLRGLVPVKWRAPIFIRRCGLPEGKES